MPEPDAGPSADLAAFVADLSYPDLPAGAVRLAERCVLDTVGVTLAGADADAGAAARRATASGGEASVWGTGGTASPAGAAFANGTAGHALDFDDVCLRGTSGHPSVPVVAPALECARASGASGEAAIAAFVAGFEAQCYLAAPISPAHYERGWHATATLGTFGAAAAVASLLDLAAAETRHALNAAASMPAGLKRNFGTTVKPVHVGHAARSGLTAATLAAEGATADPAAVGGDRGFLDLYGGDDPPRTDAFPALGAEWGLLDHGVDVKKYPCCHYAHAAIAAAAEVAGEYDLRPADVERVEVRASQGAADALAHDDPGDGLQAKFSMPYVVARALVDGHVGLAAFEDDALDDPVVRRVAERVDLAVDESLPYDSNAAVVAVGTRDGETPEHRRERPPGDGRDPLPDRELHGKFRACASRALADDEVESLLDGLDDLRNRDRVADAIAVL